MEPDVQTIDIFRFRGFELNAHTRELSRRGQRVKLHGQPIDVLCILVAHRGQMVTREALKKSLWPQDTFVDFEHSLNSAINRLREALGDNADSPRFIETIPRLGYRFIVPLEAGDSESPFSVSPQPKVLVLQPAKAGGEDVEPAGWIHQAAAGISKHWMLASACAAVLIAAALILVLTVGKSPSVQILISPSSPIVPANRTQTFTATLQKSSTEVGVTWSLGAKCSAATCGTLSNATATTVTYAAPPTVPNPANVTLTATSISNKSATATVTITVGSGPLQSGYYAFAYSGWQIKRQQKRGFWTDLPFREVIAGRFYLDGAGNITNGIEDVYGYSGSSLSVPFTGTYTVGTDHTGSFTLKTDGETATYQMTLDASGQKASYIRWDNAIDNFPQNGAGYFELQNTSAFSIAGSYAFGITINEPGLSVVGRFDVNSTGAIEKGTADAVDRSSGYEKLLLTGSFGSPSSTTGRGTATFSINPAPGAKHGSLSAVYYVVSANKLLLVQTDMAGIGEIEKQPRTYSTALLNAPVILQMSGGTWNYKQAAVVGLLSPDGAGSIGGEVDQNIESTVALEQTCAGRYTVDSSGRTDMRLKFGAATNHLIAYLFGDNQAFVIQTTGSESLYGSFKPQTGGPFTAASIGGVFRGTSPFPILQFSENGTGVYIFDGSGDFTGLNYTNVWNGKSSETLLQGGAPGSYTLASNGRGTVSTLSLPFAFWAISPDEMVWINTVSTRDSLPSLLNFDRVSGGPTRRPD